MFIKTSDAINILIYFIIKSLHVTVTVAFNLKILTVTDKLADDLGSYLLRGKPSVPFWQTAFEM